MTPDEGEAVLSVGRHSQSRSSYSCVCTLKTAVARLLFFRAPFFLLASPCTCNNCSHIEYCSVDSQLMLTNHVLNDQ